MAHTFQNYDYLRWKNGKPLYEPNAKSRLLGKVIQRRIADVYKFDDFVYHFKDDSHVKALHSHRDNAFFCRIDISRFFYSVSRNRVKRALKQIGVHTPEYFAKWSTVKSPYADIPGYVVPYGFTQSPVLATLALAVSAVGVFLRGLSPAITASVYMDDICLSSKDEAALTDAFAGLLQAVGEAGFVLNDEKSRPPSAAIDIFNCSLENGVTGVLPERIAEFYAVERSDPSALAFDIYCDIVKSHTWRQGAGKKARRKKRMAALRARAAAARVAAAQLAQV
jgi:hypothetical protein